MSSPLPPDPYAALGVSKDATAAQVKTTYRKLVLKCHPDKVTDPALKEKAADDFHRIQQAYEILGDEDRRTRYNAQVKLAELRRDVMEKQKAAPRTSARTAANTVPTPTPARPAPTPTTNGRPVPTPTSNIPDRIYEERRPSKHYDSDYEYFPDSRATKKHEDYEKPVKKSAPRDDKARTRGAYERPRKVDDKSARSDRRKNRDKETRRGRDSKTYVGEDSDSEEVGRNLHSRRKEEEREMERLKEAALRREKERMRERELREQERYQASTRRAREQQQQQLSQEERARKTYYPPPHELFKLDEAKKYMGRYDARSTTAAAATARSPATTKDAYDVDAPPARRPSVRPRTTSSRDPSPLPTSSRRDRERDRERERKRSVPDLNEMPRARERDRERRDSRERRPPGLQTYNSSPAAMHSAQRSAPIRSQSLQPDFEYAASPPYPRRSDTAPSKSTHVRPTEVKEGIPTPGTTPGYSPTSPYPTTTTKYHYLPKDPEDTDHRTVPREEYDRERGQHTRLTRSPSPMSRPSNPRYSSATQQLPTLRAQQPLYHPPMPTESPTRTRPSPVGREPSKPGSEMPKSTSKKYDYSDRDGDVRPKYAPEPPDSGISYGSGVNYSKRFGADDLIRSGAYPTRKTPGGTSSNRPPVGRRSATACY